LTVIHIQPDAYADIENAAGWYEEKRGGLGIAFVLEFDAAISRVSEHPEAYAQQFRDARRVLMRRFPYAIYYLFSPEVVEVFAVLHQHQEPSAWTSRLS